MFTLELRFIKNGIKFSRYYCKKYKGMFVLSEDEDNALRFKKMSSAIRSARLYDKRTQGSNLDMIGYSVTLIEGRV